MEEVCTKKMARNFVMEATIKTINYLVDEKKKEDMQKRKRNEIGSQYASTTTTKKGDNSKDGAGAYADKNVMILFEDTAAERDIIGVLDSLPEIISSYNNIPVVSALIDAAQLGDLKRLRGVRIVEDSDAPIEAYGRSKKDRFAKAREREPLWNMVNVQAPEAWANTKDGEGVHVAVVDTGIDYTHPDLKARFGKLKGYNAIAAVEAEKPGTPPNDARDKIYDPMDDHGHGTHCAGIVAANGPQERGNIKGVAKKSTLYGVKVLNKFGSGTLAGVVKGIDWVSGKPGRYGVEAQVISLSLGTSAYSAILDKSVQAAIDKGITVVAAAGNSGRGYSYPASFDRVVSVAAVDKDNKHAYFSNINDKLSLSAPGVDVLSTFLGGGYKTFSGTSMACPHVAGAAAVYLSEHGGTSPLGVRNALMDSAKQLGKAEEFGAGLLQTYDAVKLGAKYK